ncbi:MAG: hypothetical protein NPIRA03_24290 [Nitrospirales bacterium]|nr:MAG: hypothetical protein NPIRA03_24290 [Nitrospirales bacterium]
MWKQGKRGWGRDVALRKRGVEVGLAARTARSVHGPWRLAQSPALTIALLKTYWAVLGISKVTGGR